MNTSSGYTGFLQQYEQWDGQQPCPTCGRCPTCGQYKPVFTTPYTTTVTAGGGLTPTGTFIQKAIQGPFYDTKPTHIEE